MAVFIVATGSAAATTLIVTALQANTFSRDNLIALNLAVEGIEAMRNIRDTNWLKFGYDKENCWNLLPGAAPGTDCTVAANLIAEDSYTIELDPSIYAWGLTPVGTPLDLSAELATNDDYQLGFIDVTPGIDTNSDGDDANDRDLYVTSEYIDFALTDLGFTNNGTSNFYRMVQVTYSDELLPADSEEMIVNSVVGWTAANIPHRVSLSTTLTNYLKVKTGS